MKSFIPPIWLFLPFLLRAAPAAAEPAGSTLIITTRHVPPFAIKGEDGIWHGISISLWRGIAERLGLAYEFREMGLKEMLDAMEHHRVGAAVAALTITSEHESRMDFTHPFLSSGLGIAVPLEAGGGWLAVTQRFFSPRFLRILVTVHRGANYHWNPTPRANV